MDRREVEEDDRARTDSVLTMSDEIKLGKLEFTAEEAKDFIIALGEKVARHAEITPIECELAEWVNQILREKIAKAPEVKCVSRSFRNWWESSKRWPFGAEPTLTARLICIESVK